MGRVSRYDDGSLLLAYVSDTHMRSELETRMTHIQPAELLLPDAKLSRATEKVLNFFAGVSRSVPAIVFSGCPATDD